MRQYNKSESGCETMGIDIEQTRQYYTEIKTEDLCDCDYCKNYYLQVKEAYPLVADYLNELGVDIEKPFEISPLEPVNGMLEYCVCQYVVYGKISGELVKKIGNVELGIATSYPSTNIRREHFVIDIYPIKLNWIM